MIVIIFLIAVTFLKLSRLEAANACNNIFRHFPASSADFLERHLSLSEADLICLGL